MASELTANPDGCAKFDPNPFKPEKCKNCTHLWRQHLGVIDDAIVQRHVGALRKAADDKQKAEEEVKAKAKAKKLAKQKQNAAVEDEWFFDGSKESTHAAEVDSDDDVGFQMFTPDCMPSSNLDKRQAEIVNKPLKVVNLIDFGECDVPEEAPVPQGTGSATTLPGQAGSTSSLSGFETPQAAQAMNNAVSIMGSMATLGGRDIEKERLREELDHLRQMLADSIEEKNIQVAIVRDEVAEKQVSIEELAKKRAEAEASLQEARAEVEALRAQLSQQPAAAPPAEDAAGLRAEVEQLRGEVAEARAAQASAEADAAAARAEAKATAEAAAEARKETEAASAAEAYAAALEMHKHTAEVLRDLRIKADHQMSWLTKRMCESHIELAGKAVV